MPKRNVHRAPTRLTWVREQVISCHALSSHLEADAAWPDVASWSACASWRLKLATSSLRVATALMRLRPAAGLGA